MLCWMVVEELLLCIFDSSYMWSTVLVLVVVRMINKYPPPSSLFPCCIFSPSRVSMEHLARVNTGPQWATINYIRQTRQTHGHTSSQYRMLECLPRSFSSLFLCLSVQRIKVVHSMHWTVGRQNWIILSWRETFVLLQRISVREIKLHNKAEVRVGFLLKFYSKWRLSLTLWGNLDLITTAGLWRCDGCH